MPSNSEMICPVDRTPLVMSERQNIEIDYCPTCRGVWLDRGELDKIIERSTEASSAAQPVAPPPVQTHAPQPGYGADYGAGYGHGYQKPYHKRRKSFLEELFD
jgi:Zn-finger nucleic acid-binding protein